MGTLKSLEARLACLEARVAAIPDPEEQEASRKTYLLHEETWLLGGSFEDIPAQDRDSSTWEFLLRYGPSYLGLVWEGILPGREELLAAGVDFTRASGCEDFVGGRLYGAHDPDTPRKL